jgi:stress response protein SCP2
MGLLDRSETPSSPGSPPRHLALIDGTADLTGPELLAAAQSAHDEAEREFDRSLDTRAVLEEMYLRAARSLEAEKHAALGMAWLGLATVRRYQKGRREDALEAFDSALAASPDDLDVWDAYLDYITYAASAASLIGIVERMPVAVRAEKLRLVVSVGHGADRWGTMSLEDQKTFTAELPAVLERLGDHASLGTLLSEDALREYRVGSHDRARDLMRRAVATGYPSPACVDRLTIDLVKQGKKAEAAVILRDALERPIPSDSLRVKMTKRLARCGGTPTAAPPAEDSVELDADPLAEPAPPQVQDLRPGENAVVDEVSWRAQVGWHDPHNMVDVDACVLLLNTEGRVGADTDFVFYNQLVSPDGSVRHGGEQTLGSADLFEEIQIDLRSIPARVSRVVVCASVHEGTFADVAGLHVRLEGGATLVFDVPRLTTERAVVLFEFYRREQAWKVRAMGQGYDDGLAGLARDFGVNVD